MTTICNYFAVILLATLATCNEWPFYQNLFIYETKISPILKSWLDQEGSSVTVTMPLWILFTDKGSTNENRYSEILSQMNGKTLNRRKLRMAEGSPLISDIDLPVRQDYIDAVIDIISTKKIKIRSVSKWLNAISIQGDLSVEDVIKIAQLDCVKEVDQVAMLVKEIPKMNRQEVIQSKRISKRTPTETIDRIARLYCRYNARWNEIVLEILSQHL
jgi:hypothetical protein